MNDDFKRLVDSPDTDAALSQALRSAKEGGASPMDARKIALGVQAATGVSLMTGGAAAMVAKSAVGMSAKKILMAIVATSLGSAGAYVATRAFQRAQSTEQASQAAHVPVDSSRGGRHYEPLKLHAAPVEPEPIPQAPSVPVADVATTPVMPAPTTPHARTTRPTTRIEAAASASAPAVEPAPVLAAPARATEFELLDRAHHIIAASPQEALAVLDEHARLYANGVFAEERQVLRVQALLALGRVQEARTVGEAFIAAHPTSSHARRIRRLLEL